MAQFKKKMFLENAQTFITFSFGFQLGFHHHESSIALIMLI
jgi:hypothetical protein